MIIDDNLINEQNIITVIINSYFSDDLLNIGTYVKSLCKKKEDYRALYYTIMCITNDILHTYNPLNDQGYKISEHLTYKNKMMHIPTESTHLSRRGREPDPSQKIFHDIHNYLRITLNKMCNYICLCDEYKKCVASENKKKAVERAKILDKKNDELKKKLEVAKSEKIKYENEIRELKDNNKRQNDIIEYLKGINNNAPLEECNICMDRLQDKKLFCGCTTKYCTPCARKLNFKCCTCKKNISNDIV